MVLIILCVFFYSNTGLIDYVYNFKEKNPLSLICFAFILCVWSYKTLGKKNNLNQGLTDDVYNVIVVKKHFWLPVVL